tara:strand:- start:1367 stop:1783 length:417 start_codon:yes stop_codon:yes gene_type:complete
MKWLNVLMIAFLLSSCSAQWHLKRAVKKDPTILVEDTLVVKDTVVVPPVVITDTVTTKQHDTIIVQKDRLKVRIVKRLDTLIIEGQCASDTIVRTIEVPVPSIVMRDSDNWYNKVYKGSFYLLLLILLFLYLKANKIL